MLLEHWIDDFFQILEGSRVFEDLRSEGGPVHGAVLDANRPETFGNFRAQFLGFRVKLVHFHV